MPTTRQRVDLLSVMLGVHDGPGVCVSELPLDLAYIMSWICFVTSSSESSSDSWYRG